MIRLTISAFYRLVRDNGFSLASAVAFSFLMSVFPFFVFLGSLIGYFGWEDELRDIILQLFAVLPDDVEAVLLPEIDTVIRGDRIGLITVSGLVMLFFASSGIETLRGALNRAYRDEENRGFLARRLQGFLFVFTSAAIMIVVGAILLFAPQIAREISPLAEMLVENEFIVQILTYVAGLLILIVQLLLYHIWLPAGRRRLSDIFPGIFVSTILWLLLASLFSIYVNISDFGQLYGRLTGIAIALTFFYFSSVIIVLGAEYNRARLNEMAEDEMAEAQAA